MRFGNDWDIPDGWRGAQFPRRGGLPFDPPRADPGAPERLVALLGRSDLQDAANAEYDSGLLDEARRFAADLTRPGVEPSPRGAAAAGLLLADHIAAWSPRGGEPRPEVAEAWIARAGVVFAVRAIAEMAGMLFHPLRPDGALCRVPIRSAVSDAWRDTRTRERLRHQDEDTALFRTARPIRAHLAAADDATYARAAAALHGYRDGDVPQRLIASFVLPDQDAWVEADVEALAPWMREFPQPERVALQVLPVFSATSAAQVQRHSDTLSTLDDPGRSSRFDLRLRAVGKAGEATLVMTLLDGLGSEAVRFLTDHPIYRAEAGLQPVRQSAMTVESMATVLRIPADEAMRYVVDATLAHRQADFHRLGVVATDPARALRVLAAPDAPPLAADVLGMAVLATPALLDALPAGDRATVEAVVGDGSGVGARLAAALDDCDLHGRPGLDRKQAVAWLASIDTDEAFGLLAARADRALIRPLVVRAATRQPERALRVLAGLAPERPEARVVVAELLHDQVLSRPDLVAAALPQLDPEARARVEAITATLPPAGPVAPESALPAILRATPKAKVKALPAWVIVPGLPQVRLRDHGGAALPEPAVRRLLTLLTLSTFAAPHPGLAEVRRACERASLTAFAWALCAQWGRVEHPAADKQALYALAFLGDDSAAPRLTELVLGWTENASARARIGLEVFVALGTDTALTHLQRMARTAKAKGFRRLAAQRLDRIAAARGLTTVELSDRIADDLGLDADGRLTLDFGPRQFVVTCDVKLNPLVADADGRRLKGLPRGAATDDPELAEKAKQVFAALRKQARAVATERLRALEDAMMTERSWTATELRTLLLDHPSMRYPARALLWQAAGGPAFRVAEDGSLADVDDKTITLDDDQRVTLYHPALAGAELPVWAEIFADYEVFQPFAQLDRAVYRPDPAQAATDRLPLATGAHGDLDILHPLAARGWRFTDQGGVVREWPGGFTTLITPDEVRVLGPADATFGTLGPVAASETLREAFRLQG